MRRLLVTACLALAALGAIAPAAGAQNPFRAILDDFSADGQITPCRFSAAELNNFLNVAPGDTEQYAPGLLDQVQAALQAQAGGACNQEDEPAPSQEPGQAAPAPQAAPPPPSAPAAAPEPEPVVEVAEPPAPKRRTPAGAIEASAKAPAPPVVATAPVSGGAAPVPLWLLAALAGVAALAAVGALVAWLGGWSGERVTRPLTAAVAEAGGRGADLAAEFADWLRLGR